MKPDQAKGYILESVVLDLLKEAGYVQVKTGHIRGRGAEHQIDAYGVLSIPSAFIYPIRLLSEAKFYNRTIGLGIIRNFVGVIKDISENYIVTTSHKRSSFRYTDSGCIFSATPFVESAQEYAWAHNIFLISFSEIELMKPVLMSIGQFVQNPDIITLLNDTNPDKQKRLIRAYKKFQKNYPIYDKPTLVVGILDEVYPIILVGKRGWIQKIEPPTDHDQLDAVKDYRQDFPESDWIEQVRPNQKPLEHIFHITIQNQKVMFNLPHFAATKILDRIKKDKKVVAQLQIPFKKQIGNNLVRRIISLNVKLPIQ